MQKLFNIYEKAYEKGAMFDARCNLIFQKGRSYKLYLLAASWMLVK